MQIRFPRKIRLGYRPVYGLTIRQLIYLAVFGIAGGLTILAGPFQGASILVRALIGVVIMIAGLSLAFLRIGGLSLDEWLPIGVRYVMRPRKRVWRKRDVQQPTTRTSSQVLLVPEPASSEMPANVNAIDVPTVAQNQKRVVIKTAIVAIDAFILFVLGAATLYLRHGGLAQVQITLAQLWR